MADEVEDQFPCPDCGGDTCSVCGGCEWAEPGEPCYADHEWC